MMFCSKFSPIVGGAERQAEKLSKALARRGLCVTVLTPKIVGSTSSIEKDNGVVIHRFPLIDIYNRIPKIRGLGPLNLLLIRTQVRRAVSRYASGSQIVHCHIASPMSAFAMQAAQKKQIPAICKVAMAGDKTDLGELAAIGIGGPYLANSMVRMLDRWIATTDTVRQSLLTWGVVPEKIAMIPNGVEIDKIHAQLSGRKDLKRFLYLGRLSSNTQRDIRTLIHAFDLAADQISNLELAIVGDGDQYQEIKTIVSQSRNKKHIKMPGFQQPERWLKWADCFVLPSLREGMSNALLEAMESGLACIANDIPPNREVLEGGEAGILVPIGDKDRLAYEMTRLVKQPDIAEIYIRRSLERVRAYYSIESVADRYIELYRELATSI
jgi:glycosyltransferase involved in cell wall biosynthesis